MPVDDDRRSLDDLTIVPTPARKHDTEASLSRTESTPYRDGSVNHVTGTTRECPTALPNDPRQEVFVRLSRSRTVIAAGAAILAVGGSVALAGHLSQRDKSSDLRAQIDSKPAKNVILLIGDGMGDSEMTLARYYGKGAEGRLNMDRLPFRGSSLHYVLSPGPGPKYAPNYAGDSAPTASAWSTGKRTVDGRISQGPSEATNVPGSNTGYGTYMEAARRQGKATGNVSTAEITDATPAGPSSHISQRACQGPADARTICPTETKAAGGLGSIAEQQVDQGFDVYLGGGRARYAQTIDGSATTTVLDVARRKGYRQQPSTAQDLAKVRSLRKGKVLGLFHDSNMTTEYAPLNATPEGSGSPETQCDTDHRPSNEPSLADMTKKAIDLLDDEKKGFVLQVEGASIDKRDHAGDVCGQIGETLELDNALGVALDFQRKNPDTLIIVTADHSHTSQIINANQTPAPGAAYATLKTVDGAPIRVVYGTATHGGSYAHTGAQVPVWAKGPRGAEIQGTIDQTDIFGVVSTTRNGGKDDRRDRGRDDRGGKKDHRDGGRDDHKHRH